MRQLLLLLTFISISLPVHARLRFIESSNKHYQATSWKDLIVYLTDKEVPKDAEKLGLMICESEDTKDMFKTITKAKKIAADYGATGIYFLTDDSNPVLASKRYDKEDKKYQVKEDFKSNMTIVAIRCVLPSQNPSDTSSNQYDIVIDDVVMFKNDNGDIVKGKVIAINHLTSTAIIKSRDGKKERPLLQVTKVP